MHIRRTFVAALFVALIAVSIPAYAHHGAAAYDMKTTLNVKATITGFMFINPHVQIYFDAPDAKGDMKQWSCETIDPAMLERQGWSRETLKPGDHVTIVGHPAKSGANVMLLQQVILADGKVLQPKYLF